MSDEDVQLVKRDEAICMMKLGVITGKTTQWDAYLILGALIDDVPFFHKRAEWGRNNICLGLVDAVERLSQNERLALRDRVLGVVEFVPPPAQLTNNEGFAELDDDEA